jgi:DNA polymerase-1
MGWLPEIRAALEGNGIAHVEHADDEADDVIATLASRAGGRPVRISSTDRDYFQLLSPTVTALNLKHRPAIVRPEDVLERYGVTPEQWCDLRALAGDPSDGIPGLRGIGPKRAAQILRDGRTLDDLRAAGALPAPVEARWTDVCRWRRLVTLRTDAQVHHAPTGAPTPRLPAPAAICRGLGLIP